MYQYLWWIGEDKAHSFVLVRNNIKGNCSQWNKETVLNEAGSLFVSRAFGMKIPEDI